MTMPNTGLREDVQASTFLQNTVAAMFSANENLVLSDGAGHVPAIQVLYYWAMTHQPENSTFNRILQSLLQKKQDLQYLRKLAL